MAKDLLGSCLFNVLGAGKKSWNQNKEIKKKEYEHFLNFVLGFTILIIAAFPVTEIVIGKSATEMKGGIKGLMLGYFLQTQF